MRAEKKVFKHADAFFIEVFPSFHRDLTDGLDMEILQDVFIFFGHDELVICEDVVAAIHAVVALFVEVSGCRHERLLDGLIVECEVFAVAPKVELRVRDMSCALLEGEIIFDELKRDFSFCFAVEGHSGVGDALSFFVFGERECGRDIAEIDRRPDPEILRQAEGCDRLAVGIADRPDAPRSVASAEESVIILSGGFDVDGLSLEFELAFIDAVLDKAGKIDKDARAETLG